MTWFSLILLSVVFGSVSTLVQRILMKSDKSDPTAYMIVFQFLTAALFFLYLLLTQTRFPDLSPLLPNILLSGFLVAVASLFMFRALKQTEASEYTIINTSGVFWSLISSSLFLHETITLQKIFGSLLIILGIVIIVRRKQNRFQLTPGHLYTLLSAFAFSLSFTNDAFIVQHIDITTYLAIGFFLPGLIVLIARPKSVYKMRSLLRPKLMLKISLFSVLYALAAITIFAAYKAGGDVSQVYPIGKLSIIITVILAAVFLKERDHLLQKALGALAAFIGALLLR